MGEKQKVLITEESHDGVHYVAHNKSYDQVKHAEYVIYLFIFPIVVLHAMLDKWNHTHVEIQAGVTVEKGPPSGIFAIPIQCFDH